MEFLIIIGVLIGITIVMLIIKGGLESKSFNKKLSFYSCLDKIRPYMTKTEVKEIMKMDKRIKLDSETDDLLIYYVSSFLILILKYIKQHLQKKQHL